MSALFLAPHSDDETLFGAFTLIRHRPRVVVVLSSRLQETAHGFRRQPDFIATQAQRAAETEAALTELGLDPADHLEQWDVPDDAPDWALVEENIRALTDAAPQGRWDRVFAPASEPAGHPHHTRVGEIADDVFGPLNVTHYLTYVNGRGRSAGVPVPYERPWIALKLRALACYESQIRLESTSHHFTQPLDEFYAE